jgi:hypothetical protein
MLPAVENFPLAPASSACSAKPVAMKRLFKLCSLLCLLLFAGLTAGEYVHSVVHADEQQACDFAKLLATPVLQQQSAKVVLTWSSTPHLVFTSAAPPQFALHYRTSPRAPPRA